MSKITASQVSATRLLSSVKFSYLIGVGSNIGDRFEFLKIAANHLKPILKSKIYETEPVGIADQKFLNACFICESSLSPNLYLDRLLAIEKKVGRVRNKRWENRQLDLDILLGFDGGVAIQTDSKVLTIPHPYLLKRDFVLVPAVDVAPHWIYPESQKRLGEYLFDLGFTLPPSPIRWTPDSKGVKSLEGSETCTRGNTSPMFQGI